MTKTFIISPIGYRCQATAAIRHPNVVAVHSLQLNSATPYILFDYVRGQSLDHFIDEPWTLEQLIPFLRPVAEALDYIHEQGLIHRDLKPANIIAREHDRCPLLADFGLARGGSLESLTQTGMVKGTPSYMAPEQLQGLKVGPGVDLWAFAVMTYQLLSGGTLPFIGENPIALASAVMLKEAPPISKNQVGLPEALDTVFSKAFAKETDDRYESVTAFLDDCERARIGEPILGQAPASYKGALRNFHAGGARAAFKLLLVVTGILIVVSGISFGIWSQWQSSETERQLAELKKALNPKKIEKRFRVDFYREFERRLIEKVTGVKTDIVRPDYLAEDEKLAELATTIENLAIEKSQRQKFRVKQERLQKLTGIWALLEGLTVTKFKLAGNSLDSDWAELGRPYGGLLKAGFLFFREDWEEAFVNLEPGIGIPEKTLRLGRGLIAWNQANDSLCMKELGFYLVEDKENAVIQNLIKSSRRRSFVGQVFLPSKRFKNDELIALYPNERRTPENVEWRKVKAAIRKKWAEFEDSSNETKLVDLYDNYFTKRALIPQLDMWPLSERLLKLLLAEELKSNSNQAKVMLYSILLIEFNPKAKVPDYVPVKELGTISRAIVEARILTSFKLPKERRKLFDTILLFGRYGLFLGLANPGQIRVFEEEGIIGDLLAENKNDPFLRFWRGGAKESAKVTSQIHDLTRPENGKVDKKNIEQAKKLWRTTKREEDLLFSLNSGVLVPSQRAQAIAWLCRIWILEIEFGLAENPGALRDKGIAWLSPVIKDHPDPSKALGVLMNIAALNQESKVIKDQFESWIEESERQLNAWKAKAEEYKKGRFDTFRKSTILFGDHEYDKRLAAVYYRKARLYAELNKIEQSLRFLKLAAPAHYDPRHVESYYSTIQNSRDPNIFKALKKLLKEAELKNADRDTASDISRRNRLLQEIRDRIK